MAGDGLWADHPPKIGDGSELDPERERTYRVELTIQNPQRLLRPGMTVFARGDFGRRMVGWLLAHKLRQALPARSVDALIEMVFMFSSPSCY
jgi:hypothetical protein